MTAYERNGYKNRKEYLQNIAEENGVDFGTVLMLANVLGKSEDFDGLVNAVQDLDGY